MMNPKHESEYDALAADIEKQSHLRTVFVPSPGNWGDSLINAGTREFFSKYDIKYREIKRTNAFKLTQPADCHFIIGGGGGWCRFWHSTPEFVMSMLPKAGFITVLPTSIADAPKQPAAQDNLRIYSRGQTDLESMDYDLRLCHDMALHCTDWNLYNETGIETLVAMREDAESRFAAVPKDNNDISLQGNGYEDSRPFYHRISAYSNVRTDRLHVAIAAAQLGKVVELIASGYSKSPSVYTHSLAGIYPNVELG